MYKTLLSKKRIYYYFITSFLKANLKNVHVFIYYKTFMRLKILFIRSIDRNHMKSTVIAKKPFCFWAKFKLDGWFKFDDKVNSFRFSKYGIVIKKEYKHSIIDVSASSSRLWSGSVRFGLAHAASVPFLYRWYCQGLPIRNTTTYGLSHFSLSLSFKRSCNSSLVHASDYSVGEQAGK